MAAVDDDDATNLCDFLVLLDDIDNVPPTEPLHVGKLGFGVVEDVGEDGDLSGIGRGDEVVRRDERAADPPLAGFRFGTDLLNVSAHMGGAHECSAIRGGEAASSGTMDVVQGLKYVSGFSTG